MSAYKPDDMDQVCPTCKRPLGTERYLVRILAALCKRAGGKLRIKGELVDTVGEATTIVPSWNKDKQEVEIIAPMGMFPRVFRVTPEREIPREVQASPQQREQEREIPFDAIRHKNVGLDDQKLSEMERTLMKRRIAGMINEEMKQKRRQAQEA